MTTGPVHVIAEAGVNHNGQRDLAFALIDIAADAGADAVKFQTFDAATLASASAPKAQYQRCTTAADESQLAMLRALELPRDWHAGLQAHARQRGLEFLSTPFDAGSLEFLDALGVPRFKIPSGELVNGPLLWRFARTGKPLILSTGMATLGEVEQALAVIAHGLAHDAEPRSLDAVWRHWSALPAGALRDRVTLLHCTSRYPTPLSEVNLLAMDTLAQAFGLPVGYSDHTEGTLVPIAAVARGARVIEKHFTIDRALPGPDHRASLEPDELRRMVADIRALGPIFGDGRKAPTPGEWDTRQAARQQVVAARAIRRDSVLTRDALGTARTGAGLAATELWRLVGTRARRDFSAGEAIDE